MIELMSGDLLEANAEALVNAVNCRGVMGAGIALAFKERFPDNFYRYRLACDAGQVCLGSMFTTETGVDGNPRYIINFPTVHHWRDRSRLEDIQAGLASLVKVVTSLSIGSIAIPALGCGHGRLRWSQVQPVIESAFRAGAPDVRVLLFAPQDRA